MSKLGKFLAVKKGKTSVKASVDTALQISLNSPEAEKATDLLDALKSVANTETDDWGADSDGESALPHPVVVGGHFHLISEEDVSRKQQRKPKKWGEVAPAGSAPTTMEPAVVEEKPVVDDAPVELKPVVYRPGKRVQKMVDMRDGSLFPGLEDAVEDNVADLAVSTKRKQKKIEKKVTKKQEQPESINVDQETLINGTSLILIEEFLLDVIKPQFNAQLDAEASCAKFVGRKKRPYVPLPIGEQ